MDRIQEFHNIVPITNLMSVLERGLLSYESAARIVHQDISMPAVQENRDKTQVPGGLTLHQYANVYFHARNPMMFARQGVADDICVLRVNKSILSINGVVVTDQNAASRYVRFLAPFQMNETTLDLNGIYADDWRHENQIEYWRRKSRKCAEVLVPHRIGPEYFTGIYVVDQVAADKLIGLGVRLPIEVNGNLFFR